MRTNVAALWTAILCLAGCGMAETGEVWSTKDQSIPKDPAAGTTLHVRDASDVGGNAGLRRASIELLLQAMDSDLAELRADAIQGMASEPQLLEPLVTQGLADDNRGVRFVAVMTIGRFKMDSVCHLLEPMLRDESESVQAAAIYGMRQCGMKVDQTPLASMVASDNPEVRANAAMVLGELGNPSAVPMIRQAAGTGMERASGARAKMVQLQMAESLVMLGEEDEIVAIRATLFAPPEEGELTALACMISGRLRDERVVADLVRLARRTGRYQQPAEIRMAATWALAHMGTAQASTDVPLAYLSADEFQLRVQAALTLGEIGDPAVLRALSEKLSDSSPRVQVAAAAAILQILNGVPN